MLNSKGEFLCTEVNRRIKPLYSEVDISSGLKVMGYSEYEILCHIKIIKERKRQEKINGDDEE